MSTFANYSCRLINSLHIRNRTVRTSAWNVRERVSVAFWVKFLFKKSENFIHQLVYLPTAIYFNIQNTKAHHHLAASLFMVYEFEEALRHVELILKINPEVRSDFLPIHCHHQGCPSSFQFFPRVAKTLDKIKFLCFLPKIRGAIATRGAFTLLPIPKNPWLANKPFTMDSTH